MHAQYKKIKQHISGLIDSGEWGVGHRTPSDNQLAEEFGVSRMTANRALRELTADGLLTRVAGVGTFVIENIPQAPLFEIKNIADEIRGRGHRHHSQQHQLQRVVASGEVAMELEMAENSMVYHSVLVHFENDIAVQLEDRYINPILVPHYLDQDFSALTPNEYLTAVAPLTEAEHIIEAILPDSQTQYLLSIDATQPCLLLHRRTWSGKTLASCARLTHPSNRYRLGGHFVPQRQPNLHQSNALHSGNSNG